MRLISHYSRTNLLENTMIFQKIVATRWNKNTGKLSELMTLGVSKFPDHTTKGTGMVNIEVAREISILEGVMVVD